MQHQSSVKTPSDSALIMGIDVGTSGMRAVILNSDEQIVFENAVTMPFPVRENGMSSQSAEIWIATLQTLLENCQASLSQVQKVILDATSSTVLLVNKEHQAICSALMYDDRRATEESKTIKETAPPASGAHGASSTLAKVMWLEQQSPNQNYRIFHQIDFINHFLANCEYVTDENNALKLGYDSVNQCWPEWVKTLTRLSLPKIVQPGTPIGNLKPEIIEKFGFHADCQLHAGTTDSIAAFLASGANLIGDAVTSLGSTLAIKLLSDQPVFAPEYGIYSHKLGNMWLAGGASNAGGAVLLHYFTLEQLIELLPQIDLKKPTELNYYPLASKGERFPVANPDLEFDDSNRPESDVIFLQGLIEGLTEIERLAFERLNELGCPEVNRIFTAGGGNQNAIWMTLREKHLHAEITQAAHIDAAYGVTRLLTIDVL